MHPELLKRTVRACRDYIDAGDYHGEAPPTERLIAAVVQLANQIPPTDKEIYDSIAENYRRDAKLAIVGASAKLIDEFCSAIDAAGVGGTAHQTIPQHKPIGGDTP